MAAFVVPYLQGRCLDIGSGQGKVWPRLIGIDPAMDGARPVTDMCMDGTDLSLFGDESMDGVFSSFFLNTLPVKTVPTVLTEWARVIRTGGHIVLYLPFGVPDEAESKPEWQHGPEWVVDRLRESGSWELLESEIREDGDEYAVLIVAKKAKEQSTNLWERNPAGGKKRALIIRMGAIGDAFVAASVLPGLKAQGYHITFNAHPSTKEVLKHDPHIDEWLIQDKDFVPNEVLGPYWNILSTRYDRVVNLCESVEGLLLALPGRLNHGYSHEARRAIYDDINYLEHTHNIAAVPHEFSNAKFHMTALEKEKATYLRGRMKGPVIVWCVNGSSPHKVYPWVQIVAAWLIQKTPAHLVMYADPGPVGTGLVEGIVKTMKENGVDMDRVHPIGGAWPIRKALSFAHMVDCVVGPETGPLNAVGMTNVPKVIYLSHSSARNLTAHWKNTTVLEPESTKAHCYPCHRLHFDWSSCHQDEQTSAALCASSISPEKVFEAIALAIGARKYKEANVEFVAGPPRKIAGYA